GSRVRRAHKVKRVDQAKGKNNGNQYTCDDNARSCYASLSLPIRAASQNFTSWHCMRNQRVYCIVRALIKFRLHSERRNLWLIVAFRRIGCWPGSGIIGQDDWLWLLRCDLRMLLVRLRDRY